MSSTQFSPHHLHAQDGTGNTAPLNLTHSCSSYHGGNGKSMQRSSRKISLSPYGVPTGTRGPAVSDSHTLLLASHQVMTGSQPASISVGQLPPLQAPVFRVLVSFLSTVSRGLTHERLSSYSGVSVGRTGCLSRSRVGSLKFGMVRLSVSGKLHCSPSLFWVSCLGRDPGYVQIADRKPVLPGRLVGVCFRVRAARFVVVGLDMCVDGGWLLLHDLVRGVRDCLSGSRESRSWSGAALVLSRVRDCW
jgi:hypothetical protein